MVAIFMINQFQTKLKKYDELLELCTGKGQDYTTGCLLNYGYYKKHYKITACNLSILKELDADPKNILQREATFMLNIDSQILTISEKLKETILGFSKVTTKVL